MSENKLCDKAVCKEVVEVEVGAEFLVKHLCHVLRSQKAIDSSMKKFDTVPKKISSGSRSVWHGLDEPFDRSSSLPIMLSFLAVICPTVSSVYLRSLNIIKYGVRHQR
jgi:hypothetical protein